MGNSAFELGFWLSGRAAFWLRHGERDRGADQVEGLTLCAGGLGEHRDVGGGSGEPDLVAGQGGQVVDQAAEAAVGAAARVVLMGGFGEAAAERPAGATGFSGAGGLWSVKVSGAQARRRCQVR
jgi:hypothetical protein